MGIFKVLPESFVSLYKSKPVNWGPLGYVTFKRTYARTTETGSTEEWYQTIERVVNGNISLEMNHLGITEPTEDLINQAQLMYDYMFNMKVLPGGRGLWASGTSIQEKEGGALTNCYYINVEPYKGNPAYPFTFAMDMLMVGAGVGYGVSKEFVDKMPVVKGKTNIFFYCDKSHSDYEILKNDLTESLPFGRPRLKIQDTREGWAYALNFLIRNCYTPCLLSPFSFIFDVSDIRPYGSPIKGFGGKASGPKPLIEMLRDIASIMNNAVGRKLSSVECMDIMCLIGRCVVAGNVRRSAEIALGDAADNDFVTAKTFDNVEYGNDTDKNKLIKNHRWASNNSVVVSSPSDVDKFINALLYNGEPGFYNREMHQKYGRLIDGELPEKDNAQGTNPCGEISLESGECCNLADIILPNIYGVEEAVTATKIAIEYTKRVTLAPYNHKITQNVVRKNRRLGVGVTGIVDFLTKTDLSFLLGNGIENSDLRHMLEEMYFAAERADSLISERLQIPESVKLTTVKPSGTLSLLAGCSPGVHYPVFKTYIRRIQFSDIDPLVPWLESLGFESYVPERLPNVKIVKFPISSTAEKTERDVSFGQKLDIQCLLQKYWADNSVSCTLTFQKEEQDDVRQLLKERFYELKSTSALPITDIEQLKKSYPDLTYEPITQEKYEKMRSNIKHWPGYGVSFNGNASDFLTDDTGECIGGSCPVR